MANDRLEMIKRERERREESVARDWACGLPAAMVMAKNGIRRWRELNRILERERTQDLIEANTQMVQNAAAIIYMKESLAAGQVLDVLVERALCKEDPKQHSIGMWLVDRVAPRETQSKVVLEGQGLGSASEEVLSDFSQAVRELNGMFQERLALSEPREVIDISHIHDGKEFVERRDKGIIAGGEAAGPPIVAGPPEASPTVWPKVAFKGISEEAREQLRERGIVMAGEGGK